MLSSRKIIEIIAHSKCNFFNLKSIAVRPRTSPSRENHVPDFENGFISYPILFQVRKFILELFHYKILIINFEQYNLITINSIILIITLSVELGYLANLGPFPRRAMEGIFDRG